MQGAYSSAMQITQATLDRFEHAVKSVIESTEERRELEVDFETAQAAAYDEMETALESLSQEDKDSMLAHFATRALFDFLATRGIVRALNKQLHEQSTTEFKL